MNLTKWKGIYECICWDRALVSWKKNLPGRGLTKVQKHWSNWSSPSFSSTTFQNFPGICDLLSEVSLSLHHTKAILQMYYLACFFLTFKSNLLVRRAFCKTSGGYVLKTLRGISPNHWCLIGPRLKRFRTVDLPFLQPPITMNKYIHRPQKMRVVTQW